MVAKPVSGEAPILIDLGWSGHETAPIMVLDICSDVHLDCGASTPNGPGEVVPEKSLWSRSRSS